MRRSRFCWCGKIALDFVDRCLGHTALCAWEDCASVATGEGRSVAGRGVVEFTGDVTTCEPCALERGPPPNAMPNKPQPYENSWHRGSRGLEESAICVTCLGQLRDPRGSWHRCRWYGRLLCWLGWHALRSRMKLGTGVFGSGVGGGSYCDLYSMCDRCGARSERWIL